MEFVRHIMIADQAAVVKLKMMVSRDAVHIVSMNSQDHSFQTLRKARLIHKVGLDVLLTMRILREYK